MSRLREFADRLAGVEARSAPPPLFDLLTGVYNGSSPRWQSTVGFDQAQAHAAVYACVDVLIRHLAWQMPAYVGDVPARDMVVTNPHPEPQMSGEHWRAEVIRSAALRGYAAGLVTEFEPSGWPRKILPLHPDLVSWWDDRGRWRWRADGNDVELWQTGGNLWVAPSMSAGSGMPVGMSVLRYAASTVNLGLSAQKFGGDFFDAGGLPVAHGKVTTPDGTVTEAQAVELKRRIQQVTRNREPLISGTNLDLTTIEVSAEDSQFLQTMNANDARVAMFFGVPPEAIGSSSGDSLTYKNLEGLQLQLLVGTVGAWMHWLEQLFTSLLPRPRRVALDPESLLRMSVPTLYATANVGVSGGLLTRNEGRALIGYGPVDDGDGFAEPAAVKQIGGVDGQPDQTS